MIIRLVKRFPSLNNGTYVREETSKDTAEDGLQDILIKCGENKHHNDIFIPNASIVIGQINGFNSSMMPLLKSV